MKVFKVTPSGVKEGIGFQEEPYYCIRLGEKPGMHPYERMAIECLVPVNEAFARERILAVKKKFSPEIEKFWGEKPRISNCSVYKINGRVVIGPERGPQDTRVLILLVDARVEGEAPRLLSGEMHPIATGQTKGERSKKQEIFIVYPGTKFELQSDTGGLHVRKQKTLLVAYANGQIEIKEGSPERVVLYH